MLYSVDNIRVCLNVSIYISWEVVWMHNKFENVKNSRVFIFILLILIITSNELRQLYKSSRTAIKVSRLN